MRKILLLTALVGGMVVGCRGDGVVVSCKGDTVRVTNNSSTDLAVMGVNSEIFKHRNFSSLSSTYYKQGRLDFATPLELKKGDTCSIPKSWNVGVQNTTMHLALGGDFGTSTLVTSNNTATVTVALTVSTKKIKLRKMVNGYPMYAWIETPVTPVGNPGAFPAFSTITTNSLLPDANTVAAAPPSLDAPTADWSITDSIVNAATWAGVAEWVDMSFTIRNNSLSSDPAAAGNLTVKYIETAMVAGVVYRYTPTSSISIARDGGTANVPRYYKTALNVLLPVAMVRMCNANGFYKEFKRDSVGDKITSLGSGSDTLDFLNITKSTFN